MRMRNECLHCTWFAGSESSWTAASNTQYHLVFDDTSPDDMKNLALKMGCHPRSLSAPRNSITDPCPLSDLFLLQITLTIWPPTPDKHMANFFPKFLPLWTIACRNFMTCRASLGPHEARHVIGNRYYPTWDLTIVEKNCSVWSLRSSILKSLVTCFYCSG